MPMIFISSFMIFLANSWFSMWMIMEVNMISFICLMMFDKNLKKDVVMAYFLIQSFNSYIFLMFSMMLNYSDLLFGAFLLMMNFSMLMKLGLPPFHSWYLKVMSEMNWYNIYFMSTAQKIIPLIILHTLLNLNYEELMIPLNQMIFMYGSAYASSININIVLMKTFYAHSSIIQMSWVMMLVLYDDKCSLNYFVLYSLISLNLIYLFNMLNIKTMNQLMMTKFSCKSHFKLMMFLLFSLSGMPPFFGFLMKWIAIDTMTNNYMEFTTIFFMLLSSLISMYFYIRLMFNSLVNFHFSKKKNLKYVNFKSSFNNKLVILNWLVLIGLLIYEFC